LSTVSSGGGGEADPALGTEVEISDDGRYVAFTSSAPNLVTGDGNGASDVFVRDRDTDADGIFDEPAREATRRVSVAGGGAEGTGASSAPAMSADGRFVAIVSAAPNLVPGDTNGVADVFVRDLVANTTTRVSQDRFGDQLTSAVLAGGHAVDLSDNGRFVVFATGAALDPADTDTCADVYRADRDTDADGLLDESGTVAVSRMSTPVEPGSCGDSTHPASSVDGRIVAFISANQHLVTDDDDRADDRDVFVRDASRAISLVSAGDGGGQADGASRDSRAPTPRARPTSSAAIPTARSTSSSRRATERPRPASASRRRRAPTRRSPRGLASPISRSPTFPSSS
jgi:Tol biopolymer transport system component